MPGGVNGPPVLNGAQLALPRRTLQQLRNRLIARLGFGAMTTISPGVQLLLDDILTSAHTHIWYRYRFLRQRYWWKVDLTTANRFYDIPYEGAYTGELTTISFAAGPPGTITRTTGSFLTDGFTAGMKLRIEGSSLNDKIVTLANVAALTLTLSASDTLAAEAAGAYVQLSEVGFIRMATGRIYSAWIKEDDTWAQLIQGIDPALFNQTDQYRPAFFDVRQYLEFWPEPDKAYEAYFYADMALGPLDHDSDVVGVDDHALFTLALAKAKFHYRQGDYQDYFQEFAVFVGKLNAETFGARRFVPCPNEMPEIGPRKPSATWRP